MGLTHEENLAEAKNLKTAHLISVVSALLLTNARDEKIYEIDFIESEKFASLVKFQMNGLSFIRF